jgi:hypothetical protein
MIWSAPLEAQLLTLPVLRCQWLPGIVPRQAAGQEENRRSRDGNCDGQAHGILRQRSAPGQSLILSTRGDKNPDHDDRKERRDVDVTSNGQAAVDKVAPYSRLPR